MKSNVVLCHLVRDIVFVFFVVKRNLLGQKRSFWGVIESLERSSSEFMESVQNTRSIPGMKLVNILYTILYLQKKINESSTSFSCKIFSYTLYTWVDTDL